MSKTKGNTLKFKSKLTFLIDFMCQNRPKITVTAYIWILRVKIEIKIAYLAKCE